MTEHPTPWRYKEEPDGLGYTRREILDAQDQLIFRGYDEETAEIYKSIVRFVDALKRIADATTEEAIDRGWDKMGVQYMETIAIESGRLAREASIFSRGP